MDSMIRKGLLVAAAFLLAACSSGTEPGVDTSTSESIDMPITSEESSAAVESESSSEEEVSSEAPTTGSVEIGPLYERYLEEMSDTERYYMVSRIETTLNGETTAPYEAKFAIDGDRMATEVMTEMGVQKSLIQDDTLYTILDAEKVIYFNDISENEPDLEEIEEPLLEGEFAFVESGTEDGLAYERYESHGFTHTYYFDGDELVKTVMEGENMRSVTEIIEFSFDPPSEMFVLPTDYEMIDFSEVLDQLEGIPGLSSDEE